jgi:hypothetical protein
MRLNGTRSTDPRPFEMISPRRVKKEREKGPNGEGKRLWK